MCIGISILLPTLVLMYMEFFVPKLGPLGTGQRHFTVYATMTNGLILGVGFTILGIIIWKKPNLFKQKLELSVSKEGNYMNFKVMINLPLANNEVPDLREQVGWSRRDEDYPILFERCNFWAGVKDENNQLIAFGYVCGMGLEHGYMEDIIVHPQYQGRGIGAKLVKELLRESERFGLRIITVSYEENKTNFYKVCGFTPGSGGLWQSSN